MGLGFKVWGSKGLGFRVLRRVFKGHCTTSAVRDTFGVGQSSVISIQGLNW